MKKMNNLSRRGLALLLVLVMCLGMLQITAFATEEESTEPTSESSTSVDSSSDTSTDSGSADTGSDTGTDTSSADTSTGDSTDSTDAADSSDGNEADTDGSDDSSVDNSEADTNDTGTDDANEGETGDDGDEAGDVETDGGEADTGDVDGTETGDTTGTEVGGEDVNPGVDTEVDGTDGTETETKTETETGGSDSETVNPGAEVEVDGGTEDTQVNNDAVVDSSAADSSDNSAAGSTQDSVSSTLEASGVVAGAAGGMETLVQEMLENVDLLTDLVEEPEGPTGISVSTFDELKAAVAAATDPTTITLADSFEITGQLSIRAGQDITLVGADNSIVLSRAADYSKFFLAVQGNLTLESVIIDGKNVAASSPLVYVYAGGSCTMNEGAVLRNNSGKTYGAVQNLGTFIMNGGEISGNTAGKTGGGVYNKETFTMKGGKISGNTAGTNGGGVYVESNKTFNMEGGEISGNTSAKNSGGVYLGVRATFDMDGGSITGNTAADKAGGVNVWGYFYVSGDVNITGNTANGADSDVYHVDYNEEDADDLDTLTVIRVDGKLGSDAHIGVFFTDATNITKIFATATSQDDASAFFANGAEGTFNMLLAGNLVKRVLADEIQATCGDETGTFAEMMALANTNGGTVTLLGNVTASAEATDTQIAVTGNVTLGLSRFTLSGYSFVVEDGGALTVQDIDEENQATVGSDLSKQYGKITGADGYAVTVNKGATFTMTGGHITGNEFGVGGEGIFYVSQNCKVTENTFADVDLRNGLTVEVSGKLFPQAEIGLTVDEDTQAGAALPVKGINSSAEAMAFKLAGEQFQIVFDKDTGTPIVAEAPKPNPGEAEYIALDGTTKKGTFSEMWSEACRNDSGTVKLLSDVNLCDEYAGKSVYYEEKITLDLNGHTLDRGAANKTASSNFYVFYVLGELVLTDSVGGGQITGANSTGNGGAVVVREIGKFTMEGGNITGNKGFDVNGAGVCVYDGGTFIMNGGTISNNKGHYGGGVYVLGAGSSFTMEGGTICDNEASNGGGVFINTGAEGTISSGTIEGNFASCNEGADIGVAPYGGGGIYVNMGAVLYLTDVEITDNTAGEGLGTGIAGCPTSKVKIFLTSGGAIYGNGADKHSQVFVEKAETNRTSNTDDDSQVEQEKIDHSVFLSRYMLGGSEYKWTDAAGKPLANVGEVFSVDEASVNAYNKADPDSVPSKVIISGNSSKHKGGGIGSNGSVIIGEDKGVLTVTKKVIGTPIDDDGNPIAEAEFDFVVTVFRKEENGVMTVEKTYDFTLKNGETKVLPDLPAGTSYTYTVEELTGGADSVGITVDGETVTEAKGTIHEESKGVIEVEFTNYYNTPETPKTGNLTIHKEVVGGGAAAAEKEYTFTVTADVEKAFEDMVPNDAVKVSGNTATVTITGSGEVTIKGLKAGNYTVKEDKDSAELSGYNLTVTGNDANAVVKADGDAEVTIRNTYKTPGGGGGHRDPDPDPKPPKTPDEEPPEVDVPDRPPVVDIPDEQPPLVDIPDEEPPLVEIPDEEPPLVDIPDEEPPLVEIPDEEPPLVDIPEEEPPLVDIPDVDVPLDSTPMTGDDSRTALWAALCGMSLVGMAVLAGKKREDEEV